ncbi:MAG: hypothetical protein ACW99G_03485 [Candidatus Thorarchaeota archaeon]|jgi:hypothetical protein
MYDIEIMYPISVQGKYRRRFFDLKKLGLINVKDKKVLVKLLVGSEEVAYPKKGWEKNVDVEIVRSQHDWVASKIADYYAYLTHKDADRCRWFAKFDDDSVTDVSALVDELDREYDYQRDYFVVTELCKDKHDVEVNLLNQMGYGHWFREGAKPLLHEWEGNVISQQALLNMLDNEDSIKLLKNRIPIDHGVGDVMLAAAARIAKIYPSECNFMTKKPLLHNFTLFGGHYSHIHYISQDICPSKMDHLKVMMERQKQELPDDFEKFCNRDYAFCKNEDHILGIVNMLPSGAMGKYKNFNESFWELKGKEIHFLTEDFKVSSIFYIDEEKGYGKIEGKYMFEEGVNHSLRLLS